MYLKTLLFGKLNIYGIYLATKSNKSFDKLLVYLNQKIEIQNMIEFFSSQIDLYIGYYQ